MTGTTAAGFLAKLHFQSDCCTHIFFKAGAHICILLVIPNGRLFYGDSSWWFLTHVSIVNFCFIPPQSLQPPNPPTPHNPSRQTPQPDQDIRPLPYQGRATPHQTHHKKICSSHDVLAAVLCKLLLWTLLMYESICHFPHTRCPHTSPNLHTTFPPDSPQPPEHTQAVRTNH